jgi:hypothetical protein
MMLDPTKEEIRNAVYAYLGGLDRSSQMGPFFAQHWEDKIARIVKPAMLEMRDYLLELAVRSRIADKDGNDDYSSGPYIGMALYPISQEGHGNWPVISFYGSNPDVVLEVSQGSPADAKPSVTSRQVKPGQITKEWVEAELKDFVVSSMKSGQKKSASGRPRCTSNREIVRKTGSLQ